MSTQPIEAQCDRCKQTRPLFLYEPDHDFHLLPVTCEWCEREKQPLLCVRCYSAERQREESTPLAPGEAEAADTFQRLVANNGRRARAADAQAEADRAMCEGIAEATRIHTEGGAA